MKYIKYMLFLACCFISFSTVYATNNKDKNEEKYEYKTVFLAKKSSTTTQHYGIEGYNSANNKLNCGQLIDEKTKKLLNDILKYPRYAVPAIIIVLGSLDMFKAVIASKEDEMKKAQKTFIKRVIVGVLVFLIPALINVIIWLANVAWEGLGYTTCGL